MAYPVSSRFRAALATSHKAVVRADLCDTTGTVLATLKPLGGNVTADIDRAVRREAGDLELADPAGTIRPVDVDDLLSPLVGNELRLYRGVEYADGTEELVPLGVFGFTSASMSEDENGVTVSIGGLQDRAARISRARLLSPYNVASGTALETAITGLLQRAWAGVDFGTGLPDTGITLAAVGYGGEGDTDPWEAATALADAYGYRLAFDVVGQVTLTSITSADQAVSVVAYGDDGELMLTSLSKSWDTTDTYNGVLAIGEGSSLLIPARALVYDDDPTSPTYWLGSLGKRPRVYSSPYLATKAQALAAATAQLDKTLGITEGLSWASIVDPSLDVGDGITITRSALGVDALYRIDRLDVPLEAGSPMTATARTRRVA